MILWEDYENISDRYRNSRHKWKKLMNIKAFIEQQQKINSSLLKNVQDLMIDVEDLKTENQELKNKLNQGEN